MLKKLIALVLVLGLLPAMALAAGQYIIPDSNTRRLTSEELWEWDYESLGFILNEIFARHGYNFIPGQKYDNYFKDRPWYTPNADSDNSRACYSQLTTLEWNNEHLVKEVIHEMRSLGTKNTGGKNYLKNIEAPIDVLTGFRLVTMKPNQKFPVYSAPDVNSYRGANGKASISTNGAVYTAGWDGGWLLVMYLTNNGSVRVGYIEGSKMKDNLTLPMLELAYTSTTLVSNASLTDDPAMAFSAIATLPQGSQVYYLSEFHNQYAWAYVETTVNGQRVRGFIRTEALGILPNESEIDNIGENGSLPDGPKS